MNNSFFHRLQMIAAITGALGVIIGAFGAHFLKSRLEVTDLETLKTAVLYLFIHVLATLAACALSLGQNHASRWIKLSGIGFMTGILLFSGSLLIISTRQLTGFPASAIGFITPLGGLCFILGWISLFLHTYGSRKVTS